VKYLISNKGSYVLIISFCIIKGTGIIIIQSHDLGLSHFNDIRDLKLFFPVEERVLQMKHEVLGKLKQARKVACQEGRRHISL